MKMSEKGVDVVWVRGNHDDFLKGFIPFTINNIEIVRTHVHYGLDGRKYFCFHGDVLDFVIMKMRWLAVIGGWSYDLVIKLNTFYNFIRRKFNLPYHSLANDIKQSVKGAINFVSDFEQNAKGLTKEEKDKLNWNQSCNLLDVVCPVLSTPTPPPPLVAESATLGGA